MDKQPNPRHSKHMSKLAYFKLASGAAMTALWSKDRAIRYLTDGLGRIPGVPAKFAQVLGSKLGLHSAEEQSSPQALPAEWAKERIIADAPALAQALQTLDSKAVTASLSQVHRAILKSGEQIVVKIQLPFVRENLEEQFGLLAKALGASPAAKFEFDRDGFIHYFKQTLLNELDYRVEAEIQTEFHQLFADHPNIRVPRIYSAYSTGDIIVQEYAEGLSINQLKELPLVDRQHVASCLTEFLFASLGRGQMIHGDLQPQNWRYHPETHQLWIYDFGNVMRLQGLDSEHDLIAGLKALIEASFQANEQKILEAYLKLGFSKKHMEHLNLHELALVSQTLCQAFANEFWEAKNWHLRDAFEKHFGASKWWFRTAGPAWFLHLMRTLSYWAQSLAILDCPVPVRKLAEVYLGVTIPAQNFSSSQTDTNEIRDPLRAQYLVVKIYDHEKLKIESQLPATTVEFVEELISDEIIAEIATRGEDLFQIKKRLLESNLARQKVLDLTIGDKRYSIELT
jgi:predicted unusual protein kinase regulating ubiquinone biosynthesis (AarF/ABC1/UbiB family)